MEIEVLKFDNLGRGIGFYNDKIIFIPKAVPGDVVLTKIISEKKNYYEGQIQKLIKPSKLRVKAVCPYFSQCGGCDLMHISISNGLDYKLFKINELLKHNKIYYNVDEIIKSPQQYNYRNKITLKVKNGQIGFYESKTHEIVAIDYCYLANKEINKVIKDLKNLEIQNGEITIRVNYKNEILLIIQTEDNVNNLDVFNKNYQLAGVIINNENVLGSNFLMDKIGDYIFKVSYDAFFQVNPFICEKLFSLVSSNTSESNKVLDLYCGVGTLGIVASKNAQNVLGVEINTHAIKDANINKMLNNRNNCEFLESDTKDIVDKIISDYDTIILDPPRSGVNKNVINKIVQEKISKIIYISCEPITLMRDLKLLENNYQIVDFKLLDMFANSEHVESFVILQLS